MKQVFKLGLFSILILGLGIAGIIRAWGLDLNTWWLLAASVLAFYFAFPNKIINVFLIILIIFFFGFKDGFPKILNLADSFAYLSLLYPTFTITLGSLKKRSLWSLIPLFVLIMLFIVAVVKAFSGNVNGWFLFTASLFSFILAISDLFRFLIKNPNTAKIHKISMLICIIVLVVHLVIILFGLTFSKDYVEGFSLIYLDLADMFAYFSTIIPVFIYAKLDMDRWSKQV